MWLGKETRLSFPWLSFMLASQGHFFLKKMPGHYVALNIKYLDTINQAPNSGDLSLNLVNTQKKEV